MKRNAAGSLLLAVLSACASTAPVGKEGAAPAQIRVEKVEFAPGPISKDAPYRIVLVNAGAKAVRVSAAPVFFSKEGYRIHGPADWRELSLAPGERTELAGSCPFTLAGAVQVRFKS